MCSLAKRFVESILTVATISFDSKIHAYGFDKISTEYLKDYLSHWKQKIKINKTFSNWANILHGVPQGSILDPLLSNVFLFDPFCLYQILN